MKNNLLLIFCFFVSMQLFGQNKFVANSDLFGHRVFIKNNGQFDKILPQQKSVEYGYVNGDEQVYFGKGGVSYLLLKKYPVKHAQVEGLEHGKKTKIKPPKKSFVHVSWENSNPNVDILVSDKQLHYQSYGDEKLKSECYKKITYKNVYDNIDIEYVFTEERTYGIKYTIIVYPGGNLDQVKIKYDGDVKKVSLKDGNVVIKTSIRNITELAPVSSQESSFIASRFKVVDNTISFDLPTSYDRSKTLLIDPWVIGFTLPSNNYGFDVDFDYAGNYFVYGGSGPFLISKYTAAGVLLWTFNGVVPSVGWASNPVVNYSSNFIVDKVSGKCYTGQGFNYGTQIIRINADGIYDNFISATNLLWEEVWDMGYDCNSGKIFGIGGGTTSNASAGILDSNTSIILPQNFTGLPESGQDIVSHAIDSNGAVYFLFSTGGTQLNNTLLKTNSTFDGNEWALMPTNYISFDELNNKIYPGAFSGFPNSNGYNALAVNDSFLYYYDGLNLGAYSKTTGVQIASTILPGQSVKLQGGIAVDACDNIYVGGIGFIQCFQFDGTTFTANGSIPLAATTALQYVTDIKLKQGSNELYVSGSGFGGIYNAINSGSCSSTASISISQTQVAINNTSVQATITTSLGSPIISYTWFNASNVIVSQTDNSTSLTNTVTNLPNGTYSVVAQFNAPCGFTTIQTFVVNTTLITPVFTQVSAICTGGFLAALPTKSTNGITGSWSPVLNNTATTTYTFTPDAGQEAMAAIMIITVNDFVIPSFTQVSPICSGEALAELPATSNNSIDGIWSPPIDNTQTTLYTFAPNTGQCGTVAQMTIVVNENVTSAFTQVAAICTGELLSNLPTTSDNAVVGTWSPAPDNTQTTLYTFTPTIGQCATTAQMTIVVKPFETPTFTQVLPICSGDSLANLPTTSENLFLGAWSPTLDNTQTTLYTFTPVIGQCATAAQMTIEVNPIRIPTFAQIPSICYQGIAPTLPATDDNGISGTWQPIVISNTASGNYVFTPTIGQCTNTNFPMSITVFDDFDFEIKAACVGNNFVLQVVPLSNSFDVNQANFNWENSSNVSVGTNSSTFDVTKYFSSNSILPAFPLLFTADVTLTNGCTVSHDVPLTSIFCTIQAGISPNDDGKNEFFDLQLLNVKKLEIFNRYGTKVYSKANYINEWVGQCDEGGILPDGVYYYVINFESGRETKVGWIYLTK